MSQVYHGLNLFWGLGAVTQSITGVTGLFQDTTAEVNIEESLTRDQRGNYVGATGYNPTEEATFTWYVTDAQSAGGNAVPSYPNQYQMVTVGTSGPWSGSYWIWKSTTFNATNTDNLKVTGKATYYPLITS